MYQHPTIVVSYLRPVSNYFVGHWTIAFKVLFCAGTDPELFAAIVANLTFCILSGKQPMKLKRIRISGATKMCAFLTLHILDIVFVVNSISSRSVKIGQGHCDILSCRWLVVTLSTNFTRQKLL